MINRLVQKLLKKDRDSERIIFEMFYQRVYYTAYYIVQDRELAQDIVQETFLKAFQNMHTVKDGEKLGAWLAAIASRTAIDYVRKIKKWNDVVTEDHIIDEQLSKSDDHYSTVETIVEKKFLKNILLREIDELKPEHKQVLILAYLHDMKYEEIAEALDIKVTMVKTRIHRAKLKLREALETQPDMREMIHNAKI
ncbi:RNA polymerase sigma factor [Lederbergia wuyishanensis]|uniref:RNA polymerase sigma factor n=1 Tax=Lederbergia wuyishanensis TaxID=1347903 RepID=A0ABU0DAV9_9BACI|nr:RNA polymerase sigma factor [Lederbergia wuyishanensis]MCJ8009665.1 RNA polymerase sigma factor [Lederbergia wuyishanensis]MDQ0345461.1 RNA polymerase sigma-70 factor (ECF subfamily) [Lederbergia wuyishanensis]